MRLALQLLLFNRTETLPMLFDSLAAQTDRDWTLYVLDNSTDLAHADAIVHRVRQQENRLPIVFSRAEENLGFAGGHEQLYQSHEADYVMCINDDAFLEPDFIARLRHLLDEHPEAGAVGGTILRWHLDEQGVVVKTTMIDSLGLARTPWGRVYDIGSGTQQRYQASSSRQVVFGISGCLPMYRRQAIGEQLFDPTYFLYKEDVDVAYRLHERGFVCLVDPQAIAYHQRTLSRQARQTATVPFFTQWLSYRNHLRNLRRHLSWKTWLLTGWMIVPYEVAKFGYLCYKYRTAFFSAVRQEWL